MLIKNTNPDYGHPGPFQVESVNQLIKEMAACFAVWEDEMWDNYWEACYETGHMPQNRDQFRLEALDRMVDEFKAGLEVVEE